MALLPQLQQIRDKQSTVILGAHQLQELSSIWSFVLDSPSVDESTCEQELGLISIMENNAKTALGHSENNTSQNISSSVELNTVHSLKKCNVWVGSSQPHILDQPAGSSNAFLPKKCCPGINDPGLFQEDDLDEVDLNIENYEELFGVALSHSEKLLEKGGIGSLFGTKDMSATDSSCQGAVAAEGFSVGLANAMQPTCSNAVSADSMISSKTEPILCLMTMQAHSSLLFSGLTGESSARDYQDCGACSILLMGEPPWCLPCPESSFQSTNCGNAVLHYKEKKKARKFEKRVRYASCKARADVRRRVKGHIVKVGDAYDYDPLTQTRSY